MYYNFLYYQPGPVIDGKPAVVMHRAAFEQGHANQMAALKAADDEEQSDILKPRSPPKAPEPGVLT